MSGRGHVDVNERRLRPVYDALDNLNNKLAIQLADKILKKQKDLHCAKALKALALLRLNRVSECEEQLEELKQVNYWDDSILQCMTMTYKEMQKPDEIATMYELAVSQHPKNEEFLSHLFMSYVRISNNAKQQKAAMSLYKAFPNKNPYYFWAVMSIFMQALSSADEKIVKSMLLPLAERMVMKYIKEGKIEAEAEVQLFLMILEKAEKYKAALDVLEDNSQGSIGNLIVEKQETVVKYLEKLEKWSKVNLVYKDMLRDRPDQWSYYVGYLDSVFKLIETCWNPGETENESSLSVDDTAKKADGFLCYQRDNNDKCRGPFLARMELQKRLLETDQDCQQEIFKQLVDYYVKFGSRNSCFRDICAYLDLLSREQRDDFVRIIKENVDLLGDEASNDDKVKSLQRQICIECIEMRLGCHENLGSEERLAKAKYLMQLHKDHLELGSHLLPTDIQPVDILALLAAHLLLRSRELRESEDNDPVWHILLILEEASGHSPSNHEFKLLLMDVYCSLGVFGPAMKMAEELEMKYIMLDTLGYKVTRYAQPFCHYQSARSFFETTMRFFTSSQKETSEQIVAAYKYGTFRKIPEIKEFKDRLNYSIQYSLVVFERMHLEILRQANTCEEAKNLLKESDLLAECPGSANHFTTLVDNRDFEVLTYFDVPSRQLNKSQKSHSFSQEVLWIRYRCLGLRLLGIANSMTSCSPENGDKDGAPSSGGYDDLMSTTGELQDVIEKASGCVDKESEILNRSIYQPPTSRWSIYLAGKYQEPIVIMTNILKSFSNAGTDNFVNSDDEIQKQIETLAVWFKDSIAKCKDNLVLLNADAKTINGPNIEHIGLIAETCNYVTIVLSLLLEPLRSRVKKPRKKKGHAAPKTRLQTSPLG